MANPVKRWLRRRGGAEKGTAALEFALVAPLLVLMLLCTAELADAIYLKMLLYNSVEAGTLYAAQNGYDHDRIVSAVENATELPKKYLIVTPRKFCGCPSASEVVPVDCNATCGDGNPPSQYVGISASVPRRVVLPYSPLGLPSTLSAESVVRLN